MAEEVHLCSQIGNIAEIKTTLAAQGEADKRIEANLEKLTEEVKKNQEQNQQEFSKINATLITLQDSANSQQQSINDLRDDVRHYTDSLNNLYGRVGKVEGTVSTNTTNIERLDDEHKGITKRVDNLEKTLIKVIIAAATIMGLIEFLANATAIKQFIFSDNTTHQVQQVNDR